MYFVLDVVPIEGEPKVAHSIPVHVNFVVLLENAHKMLNVVLDDVLHTKSSTMRVKLIERQSCCQ